MPFQLSGRRDGNVLETSSTLGQGRPSRPRCRECRQVDRNILLGLRAASVTLLNRGRMWEDVRVGVALLRP